MGKFFAGPYAKFWTAFTGAFAGLVIAWLTGGGVSEQELRLAALAFLTSLGVIAVPAPGYIRPANPVQPDPPIDTSTV